jgi:hypothetical protein
MLAETEKCCNKILEIEGFFTFFVDDHEVEVT